MSPKTLNFNVDVLSLIAPEHPISNYIFVFHSFNRLTLQQPFHRNILPPMR
eukprot:m.439910 g.439910  ORF g.439910 m.439910 type:complete len:51 (-) comp121492_c0_seq1:54-206(-)